MSKTLSNILTVFNVAGIVAKVVSILCMVGGVGCLIGLMILPMIGPILPAELFSEAEALELATAYPSCIAGVIVCAENALFAFLVQRYCASVLKAETPFTHAGAKECFRLGIASIIISVAASVVSGIAVGILSLLSMSVSEADFGTSVSLMTGLLLLFASLIFKHGAELREADAKESSQGAASSETETP